MYKWKEVVGRNYFFYFFLSSQFIYNLYKYIQYIGWRKLMNVLENDAH
jgi:hypothetical protein